MKKLLSGLCASALTVAVGLTGVIPANGAPLYMPSTVEAQPPEVIKVQDQIFWQLRRGKQGSRLHNRRINRHESRNHRRHHRHRHYRHRRDNDAWIPGAFIAGALIGGAIANSNNVYSGGGSAHVQWCYDRYRSYRASDNTFQPYNGPRRQCNSPYG